MKIRNTRESDLAEILLLYKEVSKNDRGIARSFDEIDEKYVETIWQGIAKNGLGMVALYENKIIGEIHASQKGIKIFDHLLSYLTIGIHPSHQGKGLGKLLFKAFLNHIESERPDIYRVELESRSSNIAGIKLYVSMGFIQEGRMKNQTRNVNGSHEDGVMYAWFNPNYERSL